MTVLALLAGGCVLRNPYLTDALPTSERLNFATADASSIPLVTYGPSPSCRGSSVSATLVSSFDVASRVEYQWSARLAGLAPATSYCYSVSQGGADQLNGATPGFTTPPTPGTAAPFSFAVLGDFGAGTTAETDVMARLRATDPSFVVTVGDNAYDDGTQTDYGDVVTGNVFNAHDWPLGQPSPWFAAQGNHGFDDSAAYLQNFPQDDAVAGSGGRLRQDTYCCLDVMPQANSFASAWYAFDWGNARFYILEAAWSDNFGSFQGDYQAHWNGPVAGCAECGAELSWLQNDLAAHASTPLKFAFFHYPLYADTNGEGTDPYLDGPGALEGVLAMHGVKIVFNGHAHIYERNLPQIAGTPMVSYVTGTGGNWLGTVASCSGFDAYAIGTGSSCRAPTPTSDAAVYGFLEVTVDGTHVTVAPTNENGSTFDVQTYDFSPGTGTTSAPSGP